MLLGLALLLSPAAALPAAGEPWQLARSEVEQVIAPDGHAYRVLIAWPEGAPPAEGWPVLWVLDGEDNFVIAALTARRLSRAGARSGIAPGLIVAIDSGSLARRILDYTPAVPGYAISQGWPAHGYPTGGAEAMLDLIEHRIAPHLARRWRIDSARQTLLGHSFGGLLALHALFTGRPFDVAAISPSLWFGRDYVAGSERGMARPAAARSALIASGDAERGPDGESGAAAEALAARLAERGVDARYLALGGQTHGTTMLAAMGEAVRLAFGERGK